MQPIIFQGIFFETVKANSALVLYVHHTGNVSPYQNLPIVAVCLPHVKFPWKSVGMTNFPNVTHCVKRLLFHIETF